MQSKQQGFTLRQQGFTLIELVVVIVILGILMATALPRLQNLDRDAKKAAVQGALAAISSAASITYGTTHAASTLASIVANTTFTDPLFSVGSPGFQTCNFALSSNFSEVDGYYIDANNTANSTLLASTILDSALCSG